MKKSISFLLAIILIITQFSTLGIAAGDTTSTVYSDTDIIVESIDTGTRTIYPGNEFKLTITLKDNYTAEYKKENPKEIDSSLIETAVGLESSEAFRIVGSGSKQTFKFDKKGLATVSFKLSYSGGNNTQLPIKFYYKIDTNPLNEVSDYVSIPNVQPKKEEKEEPKDDKKYTPDVSIVSNRTTTAKAGENVRFPVTIKNVSDSDAYDVSVTVDSSESGAVVVDGNGHYDVSRLDSDEKEEFRFRFDIDSNAEDKSYPIKVNFKYSNKKGERFTGTDTIYIKVENKIADMQVLADLVEIKPNKNNIQPGSEIMVGFSLTNIGPADAKDLKLSITGLEKDKLTISQGLNKKNIPVLPKNSSSMVYFPLKVSNKIKSGNHELTLKLSYKNSKNAAREDESLFYIPIMGTASQASSLIIENMSYPTGGIAPEKNVEISFSVRNRGQSEATNVIVKAESSDTAGVVPRSVSTIKIDRLAPGESKDVRYSFITVKDAPTKNYPVNIKVTYEDEFMTEGEPHTVDQFVGIFVDNPKDDDKKSAPKLIIDKYTFSPQLVEAGTNFNMSLSFFNTHKSKSVENIKIFLTSEPNQGTGENTQNTGSSVFTPVDSSNTFYIDSIKPKGRVEKNIVMFTIPDAVAKTHVITANFEYEDSTGEPYTAKELIGVPVVQKSNLEIGELKYSPEGTVGEYIPLSVEFYNTGKVTLYNMMVKLEGNFQTESGSHYIGNFTNGNSEFFEGTVIPNEVGTLAGEVVFTYEDSTGIEKEIREPFSINIGEGLPDDGFEPDPEPVEPTGIKKLLKSKFLWAIILIIVGFFGFKKYKEKKADKDILEDDDNFDDNKDNDLNE